MASANTLAAVRAGAAGIDVSIDGLGDHAGSCALEQIGSCLEVEGIRTGIDLVQLRSISQAVAAESGIEVGPLSPATADYAFSLESPGHLEAPDLFEAYHPKLVGRKHVPEADA